MQCRPPDQSEHTLSASDGNDQLDQSISIRVYLYPKYRFTHPYQTK